MIYYIHRTFISIYTDNFYPRRVFMNKREVVITELSRNCQSVHLLGAYRDAPEDTWSANVEVQPDKQLILRLKLHNDANREPDGDFVKIPESIQETMKQEARYLLGLESRPTNDPFEQPASGMNSFQIPLF